MLRRRLELKFAEAINELNENDVIRMIEWFPDAWYGAWQGIKQMEAEAEAASAPWTTPRNATNLAIKLSKLTDEQLTAVYWWWLGYSQIKGATGMDRKTTIEEIAAKLNGDTDEELAAVVDGAMATEQAFQASMNMSDEELRALDEWNPLAEVQGNWEEVAEE